MPSGKTHDKITWYSVPPILAGTWWVSHDLVTTAIVGVSFAFAGLMFSGDLDLKSVQYKRWGWFRWVWLPYQKWIPHRSPLSHGPFLGLTTRLLYLSFCLVLMVLLAWQAAQWLNQEVFIQQSQAGIEQGLGVFRRNPVWAGALLLGLWAGGLSHTLADELSSRFKRLRRKKTKAKKKRKSSSNRRRRKVR